MLSKISGLIADCLIKNGRVNIEERDFYSYAAYNLLFTTIPLCFFLAGCVIAGKGINGIIILVIILSIRRYSGGYHANAPLKCVCISLSMLIVSVICTEYLRFSLIMALGAIISAVLIWFSSPVECVNRPLDEEEKEYCRNVSRRVIVIWAICYLGLYVFNQTTILLDVSIGIVDAGLLQLVGILIKKYVK